MSPCLRHRFFSKNYLNSSKLILSLVTPQNFSTSSKQKKSINQHHLFYSNLSVQLGTAQEGRRQAGESSHRLSLLTLDFLPVCFVIEHFEDGLNLLRADESLSTKH